MYQLTGYAFVLLAALLWALLGPIAKAGYAVGMQPFEIALGRAVLGGILFLVHARVRGAVSVSWKDVPMFALFSIFGIGIFFTSYLLAIREIGAGVASILLYTAPIWVALQSRFIFKESLGTATYIALLLALVGTGLVCFSGGNVSASFGWKGLFWGVVAGFSYSLQYVFGKIYLKKYSPAVLYGACLPIGALCILPWVTFTPVSLSYCIVILAQGVLCTYMAYYAYCEGLKRLEATRVAVVANCEPVIAIVIAYFWWDEMLGLAGYAGGAMVLSAVFLMMRDSAKKCVSERE